MNIYLAEFLGTAFLILLGNGVVAGALLKESKSEGANWITICIAWGLAVTFAIYCVGNVSGAHINPAVTLGLAITGDFAWNMVPGYMLAQLAGGMTGASLVYIHYMPHYSKTENQGLKLATFSTDPAIPSVWNNLLSEAIGTFILVFGLLFIGANEFTEGLNPLVVGALVAMIGMSLGGTTGWAINPARDLGPRIAHFLLPIPGKGGSNWGYSWIPVVGPLYGATGAAFLYQGFFNDHYGIGFWGIVVSFVVLVYLGKRNL